MNTLLRTLPALLCLLGVYANVTPVKDFDVAQMNGKWHLAGLATNAQWFVNEKANMKMGVAVMATTESGDLQISYANINADGSCWKTSHIANKGETAGRFSFHSHAWNNDNDMSFIDAQYGEYALAHIVKTNAGATELVVQLFSRTPEVSAAVQQLFKQASLDTAILPENTVMLPNSGECPEM